MNAPERSAPPERPPVNGPPRGGGGKREAPPDAFAAVLDSHKARTAPAEGRKPAAAELDAQRAIAGEPAGVATPADPTDVPARAPDPARQHAPQDGAPVREDGGLGPEDGGQDPQAQSRDAATAAATPDKAAQPAVGSETTFMPARARTDGAALAPATTAPDAGLAPATAGAPTAPASDLPAGGPAVAPATDAQVTAAAEASALSTPGIVVSATGASPATLAQSATAAQSASPLPGAPLPGAAQPAASPQTPVAPTTAPAALEPAIVAAAEAPVPGTGMRESALPERLRDAFASDAPAPQAAAGANVPGREAQSPASAAQPATPPAVAAPVAPLASTPAAPTTPATPGAGTVGLERAAETVENVLRIASSRGVTHARIELHPAELGGVEIHLRSSAAGLVASIVAESSQAVQTLQAAGADLRRLLEGQGIDLVSLDISLADDPRSERDGDRQPAGRGGSNTSQEADASEDTEARTQLQLPDGVLVDVLA